VYLDFKMNPNNVNQSVMLTPDEQSLKSFLNDIQPNALFNVLNQTLDISSLLNNCQDESRTTEEPFLASLEVLRTNMATDIDSNKSSELCESSESSNDESAKNKVAKRPVGNKTNRKKPDAHLNRIKVNEYKFIVDKHKRRTCKSKRVRGLVEKVIIICFLNL